MYNVLLIVILAITIYTKKNIMFLFVMLPFLLQLIFIYYTINIVKLDDSVLTLITILFNYCNSIGDFIERYIILCIQLSKIKRYSII